VNYVLLTSDGVDLSTLGVEVHRVQGHRSAPDVSYETRPIPGREDTILMTNDPATLPRTLLVEAWQKAGSVEALMQARDRLMWYLQNRAARIRVVDQLGRYILGRVEKHEVRPLDPFALQKGHQIRLTIQCADPRWLDNEVTELPFAAATQVVLGTATSRPIVTLTGPLEAPYTLSYKTAAGVEMAYMRLTQSLEAGERRVIDCHRTLIFDPDVEPPDNNRALEWDGCKFWRLDPRHAGSPTGPWPTISIDPAPAAAVCTYRIAWL
jgi:hypothetical protein